MASAPIEHASRCSAVCMASMPVPGLPYVFTRAITSWANAGGESRIGIVQFVVVNSTGIAPTCSVKTRGFVGRLAHPVRTQPTRIVKRIFKAFPNRTAQVLASSTKLTVSYSILGSITLHFFGHTLSNYVILLPLPLAYRAGAAGGGIEPEGRGDSSYGTSQVVKMGRSL